MDVVVGSASVPPTTVDAEVGLVEVTVVDSGIVVDGAEGVVEVGVVVEGAVVGGDTVVDGASVVVGAGALEKEHDVSSQTQP